VASTESEPALLVLHLDLLQIAAEFKARLQYLEHLERGEKCRPGVIDKCARSLCVSRVGYVNTHI
jgi:hypothetical protein